MRFDWIFYVGHYKDLRDAGILTEEKAREHWKHYGESEGRMCNPEQVSFNWHYYLALNEDLEINGIHTKADADEHWLLYGKREGRLCRPDCKILCILAVHLDSRLKIDTLINNIPYLNEISAKVVVVASELPDLGYRSTELLEVLDTVEYHVRPNDPVRVCYDKYQYYLENNDYSRYDRIILTNDSYYIFRPLTAFRRYCLLDKDCIAFSASNERSYHLTDYLRCYSLTGIRIMLNQFRSKVVSTIHDAVQTFEVDSSALFHQVAVYRHAFPEYANNIMFDDSHLSWSVLNQGLEVIKLKALSRIIYTETPTDLDPVVYKYMNPDLRHLTDTEAVEHFNAYGMKEGRLYKAEKPQFYTGLIMLFELAQFTIPKSLDPTAETLVTVPVETLVTVPVETKALLTVPVETKTPVETEVKTPVETEVKTPVETEVKTPVETEVKTPVNTIWTPTEDDQLRVLVATLGKRRWSVVAKSLEGRDSKQCRERWDLIKPPVLFA